jgi:hypothetical protein
MIIRIFAASGYMKRMVYQVLAVRTSSRHQVDFSLRLCAFACNQDSKGFLLSLLFILSLSISALSQSTFSFLNTPANARLAALGGVNVSLKDRDVNLFTNNPALAGDTLAGFASASYQFYVADIGQANFVYQPSFKKIGSVSFAIQHINYGSIPGYDASGAEIGNFSSRETVLMVGKHFQANTFRFGATLKTIVSNFAGYRATALGVDVGGLFIHPEKDVTVGLTIKNVGLTLSEYSETSSSSLPFDVQVGTTFKPEHMPFRFSLTAFDLTDYGTYEADGVDKLNTVDKVVRHLNIGAELLLSRSVNVLFAYNFRKRQELKLEELGGGAGFSIGLSLQIKALELVVSRSGYGPQQAAYGFTLSTNMNKMISKRERI